MYCSIPFLIQVYDVHVLVNSTNKKRNYRKHSRMHMYMFMSIVQVAVENWTISICLTVCPYYMYMYMYFRENWRKNILKIYMYIFPEFNVNRENGFPWLTISRNSTVYRSNRSKTCTVQLHTLQVHLVSHNFHFTLFQSKGVK